MTIHDYLGRIAIEIARQQAAPDPRTIYAAGFRLGLELGVRQPGLGRQLGDRIRDEIAAASLRPRDVLEVEIADRVGTLAKILRGDA